MNTKCVTLLFLILLTGCIDKRSDIRLQEDHASVVRGVRQTLENYFADINTNGLISEFNYLDSSSDFFWVPPGSTIALSYDSISTLISQNARIYNSVTNTWDTLRIIALNQEYAMYTGRLQSVMIDTAGHVSTFRLVETGLLTKRNGNWKLLSGQTSLLPD
jgi:hypothetical protein